MALVCPASSEYKPLRWIAAEDQNFFRHFLDWQSLEKRPDYAAHKDDVMIQLIRYPQMASVHPLRTVRWFRGGEEKAPADGSGGSSSRTPPVLFLEVESSDGFNKANSFMNVMCRCSSCGVGKGWFYELNMYVQPGTKPSAHHTSTVCGVVAARNTADDGELEATKGPHWKFSKK